MHYSDYARIGLSLAIMAGTDLKFVGCRQTLDLQNYTESESPASDGPQSCKNGEKQCELADGTKQCVAMDNPKWGCAMADCLPCALPHAVSICDRTGQCAVAACESGFGNCDKDRPGCEVNLNEDDLNCGHCDHPCPHSVAHGEGGCGAGRCVVTYCEAPFDDCNGYLDDGCEVDLEAANQECGGCGAVCP
ncbi:MAG TPA: hypothetical protein VIV60_05350 [Polyangiaceae bacterium]